MNILFFFPEKAAITTFLCQTDVISIRFPVTAKESVWASVRLVTVGTK